LKFKPLEGCHGLDEFDTLQLKKTSKKKRIILTIFLKELYGMYPCDPITFRKDFYQPEFKKKKKFTWIFFASLTLKTCLSAT